MISRLSTFAAIFAVLATASIAFAASAQHENLGSTAAVKPLPVVQFETIVVTGRRADLASK